MANIPKINLVYYKNILDNVFARFFEDYNDSFTKSNGLYVFSGSLARSSLKRKLTEYFVEELSPLVEDYDVLKPNYYFIIGSCFPCDNMLLSHLPENSRFPEKLKKFVTQHPNIKYALKENDIRIDDEMFNCIFEDIFNRFFNDRKEILKAFGKRKTNLRFIKYNNLDCYSTYRIVKDVFGKINVVNLHKKNIDSMKDVIRSLNEIIGSHVLKKKEICRSPELEMVREEIREYVENCISGRI